MNSPVSCDLEKYDFFSLQQGIFTALESYYRKKQAETKKQVTKNRFPTVLNNILNFMHYLKVGVLQHEPLITAVLYLHFSFKLTTMQSQHFYMVHHTPTYRVMPFNTQRACGLPIDSILSKVLWCNEGEEYRQRNAGCVSSRSG